MPSQMKRAPGWRQRNDVNRTEKDLISSFATLNGHLATQLKSNSSNSDSQTKAKRKAEGVAMMERTMLMDAGRHVWSSLSIPSGCSLISFSQTSFRYGYHIIAFRLTENEWFKEVKWLGQRPHQGHHSAEPQTWVRMIPSVCVIVAYTSSKSPTYWQAPALPHPAQPVLLWMNVHIWMPIVWLEIWIILITALWSTYSPDILWLTLGPSHNIHIESWKYPKLKVHLICLTYQMSQLSLAYFKHAQNTISPNCWQHSNQGSYSFDPLHV